MRRCTFSEPITSAHAQAKVTALRFAHPPTCRLPSIIGNRSPLQRSVSRHTDRVRVIRAGDEIFAHYGSDYEGLRTYQPGEAAVLLKRDIPFEQYPSQIFGVSLPGDAIFRD